jgi:hypothetical protein
MNLLSEDQLSAVHSVYALLHDTQTGGWAPAFILNSHTSEIFTVLGLPFLLEIYFFV